MAMAFFSWTGNRISVEGAAGHSAGRDSHRFVVIPLAGSDHEPTASALVKRNTDDGPARLPLVPIG